jgi:predicted phage baseplate assembly protein
VVDFDRSGPTDRHYVLDCQRGTITFGNGIEGTKPPVGEHVVAERYVHGGGERGNVVRTTEWAFARPDEELAGDDGSDGDVVDVDELEMTQMRPATGGVDAESIEEAMRRFRRDLKETYRASTLDDYSYLATETPGLRFGRAHAHTRPRDSTTPDGSRLEEIRVVVVPYSTRPRPRPSEGFLDAVREHLDRNRLATDVVRVVEPDYVTVGGTVVVTVAPGYSDAEVAATIRAELAEYLHPITGFDGDGWPFGRLIYLTDVEDAVATLPGVRSVEELALTASEERDIDEYGNVLLPEASLPSLSTDELTVSVASADDRGRRERR